MINTLKFLRQGMKIIRRDLIWKLEDYPALEGKRDRTETDGSTTYLGYRSNNFWGTTRHQK